MKEQRTTIQARVDRITRSRCDVMADALGVSESEIVRRGIEVLWAAHQCWRQGTRQVAETEEEE